MDPKLRDFIRTVADTDVKKELLLYFHTNPALDSPQGLAMWINRSAEEIAAEIDGLAAAQILARSGTGTSAIYQYKPNPEQRELVERFVEFYQSDVRSAEDELVALRQSLSDLAASSLREIQREQSKTKTILTSMVDGVVVTDNTQRVVLYNPSAARILQLKHDCTLGQTLTECNADVGVQQLAAAIDEVLRTEPTMKALEVQLAAPQPVFLKAHLSPLVDGNRQSVGVVTVLRDITELKLADEQRVAFIHMMSHELRSPLTSIKGFAQSLLRGVFGTISENQQAPLDIVMTQSDRLLSLINDLLEMASMDAGQKEMRLEPMNLRDSIEKIVRLFQPQASEQQHTIRLDLPCDFPLIDADSDAMDHVFTNLLSNAIKYTLPGGTIIVRGEDRGDHVAVAISDSGIGIPPEALPKLFSRFFRVKDKKTREVTGTGLGLAIVKNYVEAQMGTIDVQTQIEVGTTFTVTMPKRQTASTPSAVETALAEIETVQERTG